MKVDFGFRIIISEMNRIKCSDFDIQLNVKIKLSFSSLLYLYFIHFKIFLFLQKLLLFLKTHPPPSHYCDRFGFPSHFLFEKQVSLV